MDQRMNQAVDRWLHFDSNQAESILLVLGAEKGWICQVTYLHFTLPDGDVWTDPSGFLFVKMNSTITVPVVLQVPGKLGGTLLPIRCPYDTKKIDTYFRGQYKNPDEIRFALLDSHLQEVATTRLIVTMHFFVDIGQTLIK